MSWHNKLLGFACFLFLSRTQLPMPELWQMTHNVNNQVFSYFDFGCRKKDFKKNIGFTHKTYNKQAQLTTKVIRLTVQR